MRLTVASGKGGTGKTLVATNLALIARDRGPAALLDADVEAPNANLFLQAPLSDAMAVERLVPHVDTGRCTHHGRCAEVCQFNAIAALPTATLVFVDLCHGCGLCALQCPEQAIRERAQAMGTVAYGASSGVMFGQGELQVGEAMATPVIRSLKAAAGDRGWGQDGLLIIDSPPGTACPVIEALRGADVALLVTEPTPFGLHDLQLAVAVARDALGLPVGVAINRDDGADSGVETYCAEEKLPVVLRLPLDREIALAYSDGLLVVEVLPGYRPIFESALDALLELAEENRA